jgi:periplasmic divalent cation tolerance protein
MSGKFALVYMTAKSMEEAEKLRQMLLEKKLAACVNMAPADSKYLWKGKIEAQEEVVLFCKTRMDLVKEITESVKSVHSYDTPCIIAMPIEGGNEDYLKWLEEALE